ncbi:hypothetical protein PN462_12400 [Spirulina sp. CS-785/01]|uniref:hypothetical protein n=1 Tax=Spirulina sp. CS-785/01 TaxID=3021716 RepID=UPI00232CF8B7|nr:hypothetical protein [Spirulina sp. CS-785/01]MDB9313905.1 hypothetical protein [Spirulina sp. CS-785/01]
MNAHKIQATINENGQLLLTDLPFQAGDTVEVIILEHPALNPDTNPYPLKNKQPYHYDDPFEPAISPDEWEISI